MLVEHVIQLLALQGEEDAGRYGRYICVTRDIVEQSNFAEMIAVLQHRNLNVVIGAFRIAAGNLNLSPGN
ncbi:hypothetical protein D3C85_1838340 [compost metagenome]